ncbi:MAG: hypothetical protein LCI00_16330 [Chloroflexi bacterium]|nr:hypothetical protein [Chloroflexota bacterium]MCC6892800.1 hypothetical protein [Anaerolineae bacterium]
MFDIDHMLNGRVSSQYHQELIQLAQQAKFVQDVQTQPGWMPVALKRLLVSLMHVIRV